MYKAEILADSKAVATGERAITYNITIPRIVLAEFNTHRVLSRNSASSRAIPFRKMLKSVKETPFIPLGFLKDHSGMQGNEYLTGKEALDATNAWLEWRDLNVKQAEWANEGLNITKQLCNRPLEPWAWHTIITTATEWQNFFALRLNPAAEIHIQKIAELMLEAANASTPKELQPGEWHIPYGDQFDEDLIAEHINSLTYDQISSDPLNFLTASYPDVIKLKLATVRCARVSYTVVGEEGKKPDYAADIALFDRLYRMGHFSPFEHVARTMYNMEYENCRGNAHFVFSANHPNGGHWESEYGWAGNYRGYIQLRKFLANENKTDNRLIKK